MLSLSITSKLLSISVCFNDSWCTLFVIMFIYFWLKEKIYLATLFFFLALSIKVSALIYLPGFMITCCFMNNFYIALLILGILNLGFIAISIPFLISNA